MEERIIDDEYGRGVRLKKTKDGYVDVTDELADGENPEMEDGEEISFYLPVYDVEMSLHNGFWQIESFFHYCQIVMHQGDNFWLRRSLFDIARALGQKEAWHAEEYYTWNGGNIEDFEVPFEDWLAFAEKNTGNRYPSLTKMQI